MNEFIGKSVFFTPIIIKIHNKMPRGPKKKSAEAIVAPEPVEEKTEAVAPASVEGPEFKSAEKVEVETTKDVPPAAAKKQRKKRASPSDKTEEPKKKRSKNVFMFYCEENRSRVKQENPGMSVTDIAKKLGEEWKNLSETDQEPYKEKARIAKEEFESQKAE